MPSLASEPSSSHQLRNEARVGIKSTGITRAALLCGKTTVILIWMGLAETLLSVYIR